MTAAKAPSRNSGIGLRLLAAFLKTAMSALVREVSDKATLGQIIFWRSSVALIPICIYMAIRGPFPAAIHTRHPRLHILRGVLGVALGFAGVIAMLWEGLTMPGKGAMIGVLAGLGFAGLIWAVLFDVVLFATLPGLPGWIGIIAITLAGLMVMMPPRRSRPGP